MKLSKTIPFLPIVSVITALGIVAVRAFGITQTFEFTMAMVCVTALVMLPLLVTNERKKE